jgi:hypothetical protein
VVCAGALWVSIGCFCTFHFVNDRGLIGGGLYSLPVLLLTSAPIVSCRWTSSGAAARWARRGRNPSPRRWTSNLLLVLCVVLGVVAVLVGEDYMRAGQVAIDQALARQPADARSIAVVQPVWVYYRLAIAGGLLQAAIIIAGTVALPREGALNSGHVP